jgi:hypothetical protein
MRGVCLVLAALAAALCSSVPSGAFDGQQVVAAFLLYLPLHHHILALLELGFLLSPFPRAGCGSYHHDVCMSASGCACCSAAAHWLSCSSRRHSKQTVFEP